MILIKFHDLFWKRLLKNKADFNSNICDLGISFEQFPSKIIIYKPLTT